MTNKKIVYIDMDGVLSNFAKAYSESLKENPMVTYPQSQYGFFLNLKPIEGAVESVKLIQKSSIYEPFILTAPSYKNPMCYAEKRAWVEKYFGLNLCRNLIITLHKDKVIGDYLIDDNLHTHGQDKFKGELIHFGSEKFPSWGSVCSFLDIQK